VNSFTQAIGFGIVTASVIAVSAVAGTLQFGVTRYINFALGDYMTLGAYSAYVLSVVWGINFWISLLVACAIGAVVSLLIARIVLAPFVRKRVSSFVMLIVTLGVSLILSDVILAIASGNPKQYATAIQDEAAFQLGPFLVTPAQIVVVAIACAAMVAIHMLLAHTSVGKSMRAISDNPDLARTSGISVSRMTDIVWMVSGALAAGGGVLLALNTGVFTPTFGEGYLFVIFSAVVVGGAGQPYGAMLGALVTGMATELGALVLTSAYKSDIAFVILILALAVRPRGLLPSRASMS